MIVDIETNSLDEMSVFVQKYRPNISNSYDLKEFIQLTQTNSERIVLLSLKDQNKMRMSEFNYCFINKWMFKSNNDNYHIQRMSLQNTKNKYLINAYLSGFYYFLRRYVND